MVSCSSLDGRLFSLNIACKVRRWTSVKTRRGFLEILPLSPFPCSCSFLLHAASLRADILWNSGSCSHFHILRNVSRPDFSLLHGFGFRKRSERVPCDRHSTLWAKMAWGMLYRLSSVAILCATSLVLTSSICPVLPPLLTCDPGIEDRFCSRVAPRTCPWLCALRWGCGWWCIPLICTMPPEDAVICWSPCLPSMAGWWASNPFGVSIFSDGMVAPGCA